MKGKSVLLLVVAMGCGLIAMLGVQQALSQQGDQEQKLVSVLVATEDIRSGIPLDDSNTVFREFPEESIPAGAVTSAEQYEERALKTSAVEGEIIMLPKLGEKGDLRASAEIPKGYRVVTIPVTATTTHAGQIAPDDRVDLLLTYDYREPESRQTSKRTRIILQNLPVFSVDNRRERMGDVDEVNAKNVSLVVTPDQAQLIMLASNKGTMHLAMRSKSDDTEAPSKPIDDSIFENWDNLQIAGDRPPEEEPEEPKDDTDAIRMALMAEQQSQNEPDPKPAEPEPVTEPQPVAQPTEPVVATTEDEGPEMAQWDVTIFAGTKKTTESFEIPADELAPATLDLNRLTAPKNQWKQWLKKVL